MLDSEKTIIIKVDSDQWPLLRITVADANGRMITKTTKYDIADLAFQPLVTNALSNAVMSLRIERREKGADKA